MVLAIVPIKNKIINNMLTIILLLILIFTSGNISMNGLCIRWNSLISCLIFDGFQWIFIGSFKRYKEILEKEKEILTEKENQLKK